MGAALLVGRRLTTLDESRRFLSSTSTGRDPHLPVPPSSAYVRCAAGKQTAVERLERDSGSWETLLGEAQRYQGLTGYI